MDALILASTVFLLTSACLIAVTRSVYGHNRKVLLRLRAAQQAANSHIQKSRMELMETRNRARLLEDTVKHGTTAVEKMHQAIATTTFSLIDHFATDQEFRENAQRARQSHNDTSRQIYHVARTTNRALHLLADTLILSRREKKLTMRTRPKKTDKPTDKN